MELPKSIILHYALAITFSLLLNATISQILNGLSLSDVPEFAAFLASSQVMLRLLVQGPVFKNH